MTEDIKFLADESCDFAVVRSLRSVGHDVVAIAESLPAALDIEVLRLSVQENRILVTEDKHYRYKSRGYFRFKAFKGEAVVSYCEPLTTKKMGYNRLSQRVSNMAISSVFLVLDVVNRTKMRKRNYRNTDGSLWNFSPMLLMWRQGEGFGEADFCPRRGYERSPVDPFSRNNA